MTKFWQLVLIIIIVLTAYSNIFDNQLIIDDQYFIQEWPLTRSWSNVGQLLAGANPESQPGVYRPIRSLLYLIYYQLWGANPTGYHLHSLLVHLASTMLVYGVIREIRVIGEKRKKIAFVAALLFGLHPIHTESITYIAASMEMTGVVFFLAAFYTYLKNKRVWTVFFALLAFFTYEMTLTLSLLLGLYELTLGKKDWKRIWPVAVAAVSYLLVRIGILGISPARGDYLAYSFYHTQLTMTKMWIKYLWLLIWPVTLSHNQTIVPGFEAFMTPYSDQAAILRQSILDPEILLSITIIIIIIFIIFIARKNHPLISFAIGWFFISLLPVAYFLPQGTAFAEKYLYIASFGWVLVLAWVFYKIYNNYNHYKYYIALVILTVALLYGVRTALRNSNWQSPKTLWEYEAAIHPQSELAYYNLGIIYAGKKFGKTKAAAAYQKALQLKPEFWQAENNLKNLLRK